MTSSLAKNLLTPVQIGRLTLRHRIVHAGFEPAARPAGKRHSE
jgi:2,4-dienoyl-CoA reductase-like NADH-dependent reductase (Old Yellow Enzyme family)